MEQYKCLYASEIAIITGHNKFQKISELILKIWQRNNLSDYIDCVNSVDPKKVCIRETNEEKIKSIVKDNNIDIKMVDIDKCFKEKDTKILQEKKNEILKNAEKLSKDLKKELTDSLNNYVNTNYGIKNEDSVAKLFETKYNRKIIKDNFFRKRKLNDNWYVGGKVDGITDNNEIIEIKNRMYKLFFKLRDYEKVQIYMYMFINSINKGYLVESLTKNHNKELNIIEVDFEHEYFNKNIVENIEKFDNFYEEFLSNVNLKTLLLFGHEEKIDEFYYNYINKN